MKKVIVCEHCKKEIEYNHDLVVAYLFIIIQTYHADCYVHGLKSTKTFFLNNHPINSDSGTYAAVTSVISTFLLFFIAPSELKLFTILLLIPFLARILSYILYERNLPN